MLESISRIDMILTTAFIVVVVYSLYRVGRDVVIFFKKIFNRYGEK